MTWLGILCFNCCDSINKDLFLPESSKSHHRHLYLKKKHVSQHHVNNEIKRSSQLRTLLKRVAVNRCKYVNYHISKIFTHLDVYFYHILHFSVHKTFFTFMNARILSLKTKQFIWFNVVHISHFLNIPATPQRL